MVQVFDHSVSSLASEFLRRYGDEFQMNQGASLVLLDESGIYFTLVKRKSWISELDGSVTIRFSGIGGALEPNESILECLTREMREEASLSLDDVEIADGDSLQLVQADGTVTNLKTVSDLAVRRDSSSPLPRFLLELLLPLRADRPSEGKRKSCLQLFVYLARLRPARHLRIPQGEDIPALLHVRADRVKELLEGELGISEGQPADGITLLKNENIMVPLPERVTFRPQFTPQVLLQLGLEYTDLERMFEVTSDRGVA